jgi:glutathione synthase/RimK-type ligase-like ATP-grasp enzyme
LIPSEPGLCLPRTVRASRAILRRVADEELSLPLVLEDGEYPLIVRPVDSHKGQGQARLQCPAELRDYLHSRGENDFYLTRFVDYRSADGQFRKYRIVLIGGQPEICHLAISEHWMVHYMSAGMTESAGKRAEEARVMRDFDRDFAQRHGKALESIARGLDLDYVGIDCGETRQGELLIFEVDSGMTVHSMDPPDLFPYKGPQMRKVFAAFRELVAGAAKRWQDLARAA